MSPTGPLPLLAGTVPGERGSPHARKVGFRGFGLGFRI